MRIKLRDPEMDKSFSVQFFFDPEEDKSMFHEFRTCQECKAARSFWQGGMKSDGTCDDWVMIEFWIGDLDKIFTAAEAAARITGVEIEGLDSCRKRAVAVPEICWSSVWEYVSRDFQGFRPVEGVKKVMALPNQTFVLFEQEDDAEIFREILDLEYAALTPEGVRDED